MKTKNMLVCLIALCGLALVSGCVPTLNVEYENKLSYDTLHQDGKPLKEGKKVNVEEHTSRTIKAGMTDVVTFAGHIVEKGLHLVGSIITFDIFVNDDCSGPPVRSYRYSACPPANQVPPGYHLEEHYGSWWAFPDDPSATRPGFHIEVREGQRYECSDGAHMEKVNGNWVPVLDRP
jgi:hypothetical protein